MFLKYLVLNVVFTTEFFLGEDLVSEPASEDEADRGVGDGTDPFCICRNVFQLESWSLDVVAFITKFFQINVFKPTICAASSVFKF